MNHRDRYRAVLHHEKPDRLPLMIGSGRQSTRTAWRKQGLPPEVGDHEYHQYACDQLGIPREAIALARNNPGVDFRMIPQFEEKVIEHRPAPPGSDAPGVLVVQDWKGNVCEISDEYDVSYLREAIDFVTRAWLKCPVENRDDWESMKQRYAVDAAARFDDLPGWGAKLKDRDSLVGLVFPGPFWQLREWLGFEQLCMLMIDDPDFTQDMVDFWRDFIVQVLDRIFAHYTPDYVVINEDMAYKEKPMIGPDMSRRFLMDCWRTWAEQCGKAGVGVYEVDSDGRVDELIPVWIDAGFVANSPQEVAAGNDLLAQQERFGTKMAYKGGIDKRKMALGGKALEDEIDRLRPAIARGGYIPACDHGIPSDVHWESFLHTYRLVAEASGWL